MKSFKRDLASYKHADYPVVHVYKNDYMATLLLLVTDRNDDTVVLPCDKKVMVANCDYFKVLFDGKGGNWVENKTVETDKGDIRPATFTRVRCVLS